MAELPIPPFLHGTTSWISFGYFYAQEPPAYLEGLAARGGAGPWETFASVLEAAKKGEFQSLEKLYRYLRPPLDEALSEACLALIGDAGPHDKLAFIKQILDDGPVELLPPAADAASFAGDISLVPSMLSAWRRADDRHRHLRIGKAIARMMEPAGGQIAALAETFNPDPDARERLLRRGGRHAELVSAHGEETYEFEAAVVEKYNDLMSKFSERVCIWRGEIFNVHDMIEQMHPRVSGPSAGTLSGLFIPMRHKVEATIGWNMSGCFRRGMLYPLGAVAVLEDIEENVDLSKFVPGQRYFFGHLVPS